MRLVSLLFLLPEVFRIAARNVSTASGFTTPPYPVTTDNPSNCLTDSSDWCGDLFFRIDASASSECSAVVEVEQMSPEQVTIQVYNDDGDNPYSNCAIDVTAKYSYTCTPKEISLFGGVKVGDSGQLPFTHILLNEVNGTYHGQQAGVTLSLGQSCGSGTTDSTRLISILFVLGLFVIVSAIILLKPKRTSPHHGIVIPAGTQHLLEQDHTDEESSSNGSDGMSGGPSSTCKSSLYGSFRKQDPNNDQSRLVRALYAYFRFFRGNAHCQNDQRKDPKLYIPGQSDQPRPIPVTHASGPGVIV